MAERPWTGCQGGRVRSQFLVAQAKRGDEKKHHFVFCKQAALKYVHVFTNSVNVLSELALLMLLKVSARAPARSVDLLALRIFTFIEMRTQPTFSARGVTIRLLSSPQPGYLSILS